MNDRTQEEVLEGREIALPESSMASLIASAEIDQQIATAHKYPRSLALFRKEALAMVTLTEVVAQECIYALPRDGKVIQGPSARFAEIMLHAWGNARAGARTVHEDDTFITAQGVCHDLQRNVAITFEVRRRITDKKGRRYSADMIGVTANAASSIALRNSILKVVPKAFWSELYTAARKTAVGDVETLSNKRAAAIAAFQHYGITEAQILARLGRSGVQDVAPDDLVVLFGILTAIKDGEVTPEEAFSAEDHPVTMPRQREPERAPQPREASPEPPKQESRPPEQEQEREQQGQKQGAEHPAPAGLIGMIRRKLQALGRDEAKVCERFGVASFEALTVQKGNDILAWCRDPKD